MQADFTIDVDVARSLVRLTLKGFFLPADVQRFQAARNAEHAKLRCRPNAHVTLTDLRELQIQSQDSVGEFAALLADPTHKSAKLALIFGTSLARLQLVRAASTREVHFFKSVEDAEAWLFGPD